MKFHSEIQRLLNLGPTLNGLKALVRLALYNLYNLGNVFCQVARPEETELRGGGLCDFLSTSLRLNKLNRLNKGKSYKDLGLFNGYSTYSTLAKALLLGTRACHASLPIPKKEHLGHSQVLAGAQYG